MGFDAMVSETLFSNYSLLEYRNAINVCTFEFVTYNLAKFIQF